MKIRRIVCLAAVCCTLLLAACGYKGPLVPADAEQNQAKEPSTSREQQADNPPEQQEGE